MADSNQVKPGSPARDTSRTVTAPMGSAQNQAEGTRAITDAKEVGTELIGAVREGASSFFEEQRNRAASEIASLGEALRESAWCLDRTGSTAISRYAEDAAGEVEQFADRLRHRSLGMMAEDVEDFARSWPMAFMAAAMGAGFLAGRFLIASASRPSTRSMTPAPRPMSTTQEPIGGARHDHGAVGGTAMGGANAGYGGGSGTRGVH